MDCEDDDWDAVIGWIHIYIQETANGGSHSFREDRSQMPKEYGCSFVLPEFDLHLTFSAGSRAL